MKGNVFAQWIQQFDKNMNRQGRHVLLLLAIASPHRFDGDLTNVVIKMLPPNTTAFLQLQDADCWNASSFRCKDESVAVRPRVLLKSILMVS